MSLPRFDHNGTFSLFDLGGLRDQFDAWRDRDLVHFSVVPKPCLSASPIVSRQSRTLQEAGSPGRVTL
jgi:hypothetical protein